MPEPVSEIETLRYELSEVEAHLVNTRRQLEETEIIKQTILNEISDLENQINNYKAQIAKLE